MAFISLEELSGPSKVAIFIVCIGNVIFTIIGIVVILVGAYFTVRENVTQFMSSYIAGSTSNDVSALLDNTTHYYLVTLCVILIATGVGVTIISMIGFCGAVQRNQHCMLGYVVFLVILIVAQSAALAFFGVFKAKIDSELQEFIRERVGEEYKFGNGQVTGLTAAFDFIQMEYDCCGVVGSSDYAKALSGWKDTYKDENGGEKRIPIPPFCCKFKEDKKLTFVEVLDVEGQLNWTYSGLNNYFRPFFIHETCLDNYKPNVVASWTNRGCYTHFVKQVVGGLTSSLLSCSIGIVIFEVICLLFSCILLCDVKTVKSFEDEQIERNNQMVAERNTILAGIQATASLGAAAMTAQPSMFLQGGMESGPATPSLAQQRSMAGAHIGMPGARISMMGSQGGVPAARMSMMGSQGGVPGARISMAGPRLPSNPGGMSMAQMSMVGMPGGMPGGVPGGMPGGVPGGMPGGMIGMPQQNSPGLMMSPVAQGQRF